MLRRILVVSAALGIALVCACQWIGGINDRTVYNGGVDGGGGDGDPCSNAGLPPNPGLNTSSPSDSVTITAALSRIMLGTTDAGPYYGFNLDKTCTCPESDSCLHSASDAKACDDPNGVDNYARRIFESLNSLTDGGFITETRLNKALATGSSGALVQITSYNGKADDGEVTVTVYGSLGNVGFPTPPSFDGGDSWIVDPVSATKVYTTDNAYVAGYELVASSINFPIIVGTTVTQPVYIQLTSGLITANLATNDAGVVTKLTGLLGGRWDPAKFLPSLQYVPDPTSSGKYLCGNDLVYLFLKNTICENTDVNLDPTNDGLGDLCNAVSMGLGFEAVPANVGPSQTPPDAGEPCGPGYTDKCP